MAVRVVTGGPSRKWSVKVSRSPGAIRGGGLIITSTVFAVIRRVPPAGTVTAETICIPCMPSLVTTRRLSMARPPAAAVTPISRSSLPPLLTMVKKAAVASGFCGTKTRPSRTLSTAGVPALPVMVHATSVPRVSRQASSGTAAARSGHQGVRHQGVRSVPGAGTRMPSAGRPITVSSPMGSRYGPARSGGRGGAAGLGSRSAGAGCCPRPTANWPTWPRPRPSD